MTLTLCKPQNVKNLWRMVQTKTFTETERPIALTLYKEGESERRLATLKYEDTTRSSAPSHVDKNELELVEVVRNEHWNYGLYDCTIEQRERDRSQPRSYWSAMRRLFLSEEYNRCSPQIPHHLGKSQVARRLYFHQKEAQLAWCRKNLQNRWITRIQIKAGYRLTKGGQLRSGYGLKSVKLLWRSLMST